MCNLLRIKSKYNGLTLSINCKLIIFRIKFEERNNYIK